MSAPFPPKIAPTPIAVTPKDALDTVERAARRGTLPGYAALPDGSGFVAAVFAEPFDHRLTGRFAQHEIRWEVAVQRRSPIVMALLTLLTIWPGLPLTESVLRVYGWDIIPTAAWYLPLTILPAAVFGPRMWTRSRRTAAAEAPEIVGKITQTLRAAETPAPAAAPTSI